MGYRLPTDFAAVSCSWQCHRDRTPSSTEPGTDYAAPYGSALYAVWDGVVVDVHSLPSGATGRFITMDLTDGRRTRYLHLSTTGNVRVGQRYARGARLGSALSGASGFGRDWYYGPHVHQTLWSRHAYTFGRNATLDFARHVGEVTPKPPDKPEPPKPPTDEELIMGAVEDIISAVRREQRWRIFSDTSGRQAIGRVGKVLYLGVDAAGAKAAREAISAANPLILPPDELKANVVLDPTAFFTLVDAYDPTDVSGHGLGVFVKNTFELTGGATKMVREHPDLVVEYVGRNYVWANAEPVEITYKGQVVTQFQQSGVVRKARLEDGSTVTLSAAEVKRADAQKPNGQTWIPV